jgi:hypothetical protein
VPASGPGAWPAPEAIPGRRRVSLVSTGGRSTTNHSPEGVQPTGAATPRPTVSSTIMPGLIWASWSGWPVSRSQGLDAAMLPPVPTIKSAEVGSSVLKSARRVRDSASSSA